MGGGSSVLNCRSKKKDKAKDKKHRGKPISDLKQPQENNNKQQSLTNEIEAYEPKMEAVRAQASEVAQRVNPLDRELVEDQLKKQEKKLADVRARSARLSKGFEVLELDLEEIQGKVDQYLTWLHKKEEQVLLTVARGYHVDEAKENMQYINALCSELENRQFTLDTVNKKVEAVLQDLTPKDREEMENSVKKLSIEHTRVYGVAIERKNVLAEALNAREVFAFGLERVNMWLEDKETKLTDQEQIRLVAADVEKQIEKAKSLMLEIEKYEPNIEQIETRVRALQQDCNNEQSTTLNSVVIDVQQKYTSLKDHGRTVQDRLETSLAARKVNEADLQKLERWCKEAEMKCSTAPVLDCATEVLEKQYNTYKVLDTSAEMFKSLLKEIEDRALAFQPGLSPADAAALQQTTNTATEKFNRLKKTIKDRVKSIDEALQTRDEVGDSLEEVKGWLSSVQSDLKQVPRTIGPTVSDAEDVLKQYEAIAERVANYQPSVAQLRQAVERLRHLGQLSEADEILRLTGQYEMLGDQVRQHTQNCKQAVTVRQTLEDQMKAVDDVLRTCEQTADSVIGLQVPVPEKIEKLKAVSTQLQAASPSIFAMGDKAARIGLEGTPENAQAVTAMIEDVKARMDNLKKIADRKAKQCESIQRNREDFEGYVNETMNWLDAKEEILASCTALDLDPQKVKSTLHKHQALSRDALDKLDTIKMKADVERRHYEHMEEPVPDLLTEKLEQIHSLEESIKGAISKKEQYLTEAVADRMQLEVSMKQINDWINGAEELLDSGYEGLDYDTLNETISEHKDYFSEASMCQDEMEQVMELSERLLPTLDMNDTATLRQSLKNTEQKLANIMASSQRQQTEMEKRAQDWNEYQDLVMAVTSDLHVLEDEWQALDSEPLHSPSQINKHLIDTKHFIEKTESLRPTINEVNERSFELDKGATERSKQFIHGLLGEVNERWQNLVSKTENKQMALQDLEVHYEDFSTHLTSVDQILDEAEVKLPTPVDLDLVTSPELVAKHDQTQELLVLLEMAEPKITALKKCAHQLQKNLPTAEAKVQAQDIVMAMLEKYERISDVLKDQKQILQEELDDRDGFSTEAKQTVEWLNETRAELEQLSPNMDEKEVMEKIEKLKLSEQEISVRMEQMRHMAQLHETKFKSQGRDVPKELQQQFNDLSALEQEVTVAMAAKEDELLHLNADRQEYQAVLNIVTTWLTQALDQLKERVVDVPEALERHNELVSEFVPFKQKLDHLRTKGSELIKHTSDPTEKHSIQKALADTNRLWSSVQTRAGEKTLQLREAEKLAREFDESCGTLERWLSVAEAQLQIRPTYVDFDRVRDQLKQNKSLLKESEQQQRRLSQLNAVVKQMEPLCETLPQMERLTKLSHKTFDLRAHTMDKVNGLEDVEEQIREFEGELDEIKQWMDRTRAHLTVRDDSLTLKDQLHMQESLISDIESHKDKALYVLEKHAELHAAVGEESHLHNTNLAAEINALLTQARVDQDELREAVEQQAQYETELRSLTSSINEANAKLIGSPLQASSVDDLKALILERNDLSRSVPSLLDSHLQDLQERSTSFGSRSRFGGSGSLVGSKAGSRSTKFDDLSSSWQNLQRQLGTKERELHVALQKQERYQSTVQDVTARMERVQQKLVPLGTSPFRNLDGQIAEQKEAEQEIECIREDIARVKERGRQIMESSDPEGYQAMQATLSMLTDKINSLQAMADDKAKILQNAIKGKERHTVALGAYKKHVKAIEDWLGEMKVRQAATPLVTDSVGALQVQLQENKDLQNELNRRLQHVADLALQCDNLCELETPESADKLRTQLATLQQNLGNLKLAAIEKQAPLRAAIKESEKRTREMDDYEQNLKNLQRWITDTKNLSHGPFVSEEAALVSMTPHQKQELQQQLQSDLSQHRTLVRQLSTEMRSRDHPRPRETTITTQGFPPLREEDLQPRWESLSRELQQKKEHLEDLVQKSNDLIGPAKYGRRSYDPDHTPQLKDVRRHLAALNDLWKQLQVQVDDKQLRLDKALEFQQSYQDALANVSRWLDLTEQKLFAPDSTMNSEEKVQENEDIQREIRSLQGEIQSMSRAAQELLSVTNADSHELIRQSLANLNNRVKSLESQAREQGDKLRTVDRNYKSYKEEVQQLEGKLLETRDIMSSPTHSTPVRQQVDKMQKIESQMKKCEAQLEGVKKLGTELSAMDPEIISPYEMESLQSNFMDLQRKVMEKKASLQESVSVQEQYEKLLADYADFLETADDKLRTEQISVRDLEHLKEQLVAHKDFFSDLEVHRAMLDSLVAQCDKATKQKHLPQHTRLSNLTYVLQDKASLHGQRLDRLVRQWGELDEKFGQLQRFLSDLETQIPKPIANQDTLQTIQNKITTFQRLQRELTDEKPVVFQVVDKGKQLLHSVNCPGLEMLVTEIAEKWVDLNTELSHELKRSQSLGDQLQVFEAEAAILKSWLTAARSKLNSIKQLSSSDMKSIATVRGKIDKILEFRKDVEDQLPLKEKVLSIGNQLLQNKVYQTADLQDRTRHLEHEWAHLEHDINNSEEYLHQAQMDLMPSRQALGELNAWLTEIEETLADEKSKPLKNLGDMEVLLKKYKSYKIDLSSKQLTVDFVNQEVLQPKDDLDGPPPAERNEFSERLGVLNGRWLEVSKHVSDRLKSLEAVHNKWEEFERSITRLVEWFHEQEDKLKKYRLIGHEVSVRQTLKDVKALQTTLRLKEGDVNHVRELGDTLIQLSEESPQVRQCIHTNMRSLADEKLKLDGNVTQVNKLLEDILSQWDGYHGEMQAVTQTLAETEYCLQRYALIGGDLATLKIQVEKLENLIKEMDRQSPRFDRYTKLATRLSEVCEPTTRQEVKKTQSDLQQRWQSVYGDLQTRTGKFRDCLEQWNIYEEEFSSARTWLDSKEKLCDELLYGKEERVRRDANLRNCQTLQRDLDQFQSQLANLYRVGEDVTKHMDPSSIVNITSKLSSLEQRLLTLRQKLAKHVQSLQGDLSQQRRFQEAFENVQAFVSQAQRILGMEDPNRSADMQALSNRLDHLKELCTQFNDNSTQLDALNDLGYRLALNETSAADLQDLNHKWQALYAETKERCKALQGLLLVQQDFTSKCDTWMTFLAQTEADLSTEIAGNLIDLLAQQKKCEKFEAESYSRQQILHAIISDGQTMMNDGDIENKEQFQQKLILLANQWQSVVRRANQRKAIIDTTIKQWQGFNEQAEKLRAWLKEKEEGLEVFTFDKASLQKIKNLVEKAKNTQNEFKLQEDMFKNMNSQGKQLLQRADDKAQEELRVSMAQVQQHWHQIFVKLDSEREKLEGVLKHWRECEDDIEEILTWLKDTRKSLLGNLPNAYEELQADMHKCKDIEVAFANAEPKRQSLLANEKTLSRTIEPEDLNVLHQRIRLLNKQWDELRNQASLRAQRIDDTMFRWSSFSQKFKELCDWIDKMEVKVISSKDYHIEDLLNRMEKDFKNELSDKEKSKNDLVSQGQGLMKVSNEVRSSDIEQKIQRLEDKWEHLKAVIAFRQRKLQETLLAVQQLDVSMNHLRKWLASMEDELSAPVVYAECERKEIQRRLQHQSELQHDIERHSPGVGSVLNLCEVLLHDSDACPTDVEFNGLQTAMKNLERRWRTICQMAPEMRSRIEETWRLWQTLIDDCQAFSDWLKVIESEVREVAVDQLNVSTSSEEFSHCETVQRKIHENLGKLENINRQYRRLAREGRTDTNGTLKSMMQDANDRWDKLQGKMSANLRDLRHSSSIREDFKRTKDALLSWLTEIDMQITNIEHLSSMNANGKMIEMRRIQDEIDSRARKFNFLDEAALYLIQKGDSAESITTQAEIDSFRQYHRQVLDRVAIANARYSAREVEDRLHLNEDELDQLERELYDLDPDKPLTLNWDMKEIEAYLESSPPESPPEKRRAMLKKLRERSRSRSQSPQKLPSNTAIRASPLLGSPSRFIRKSEAPMTSTPRLRPESPSRSRSPTRSLRSKSPRLVAKDFVDAAREPSPSRQERFNQMKRELTQRGSKEDQIENILEKLADALEDATEKLNMADHALHRDIPSRPGPQRKSAAYIRSLDEAEKSVEDVRRIHRLLKAETGLSSIASADSQVTAIVSRWEMLQAGAIQKDYRLSQCRQDWAQFHADLDNMTAWLDEAEGLQHSQKRLPGEITELDSIIRQHKDFLLQLEAKKTRVLSINLTSREIIDLATEEGRQLHDRLKRMNGRWEAVCAQATRLQSELQDALMRCQEFHHTIHDLLLWEESIETRIQQCEPINLGNDEAALWNRLRKLKDIKFDLEKNQPRVMSLRDTADQLLMNSESPEMCQAKDKMHIIANRLKALLRLCSSYISSLETRLESKSVVRSPDRSFELSGSPASSSASSPRDSAIRTSTPTQPYRPKFRPHQPSSLTAKPRARSPFALSRQRVFGIRPYLSGLIRALQGGAVQSTADISTRPLDPNEEIEAGCCHRLFLRVLRCALPLQLLLLLLLATTCLVPITEEDYSCTLANNLRRSLDTMLQYTDGPPPS